MYRPVGIGDGDTRTEDAFDGAMPDIDADPEQYRDRLLRNGTG